MCKEAHEEWLSLFNTEEQNLWNTEPTELRMIVVIYHVLQKQFKRIETNVNEKIKMFKHKMKLAKLEESGFKDSSQSSPLRSSPEVTILEDSPKIKRHRKITRQNSDGSPSLLNNVKENLDSTSFSLLRSFPNTKCEDYRTQVNSSTRNTSVGEPDVEVIDCSILNDSTDVSCANSRRFGVSKKKNRAANKSKKNLFTLTQLLGANASSGNTSKTNTTNKGTVKNDRDKCNAAPKPTLKPNVFQNYDSLPANKPIGPVHPHKTEPVRCKAERKKLPGWSCKECEEYYKCFNLPEDELREKMNNCSKHRNKFNPNEEDTPKGFWDVTIFSSQDD